MDPTCGWLELAKGPFRCTLECLSMLGIVSLIKWADKSFAREKT